MNKFPLNGIWKGFVEDTTDPNNLGRMRIRIPELHGTQQNIPTVDIPWCGTCLPAHSFAIPEVGDGAWVQFEKGDIHFPVYMGTTNFLAMGITPKGAMPSSPPLAYQSPGNSPPSPMPPDVSIINAQRQATATVLGLDVNLVPYPAGYGLDTVGQAQNEVNATLQTGVNAINSQVAAVLAAPSGEIQAAFAILAGMINTSVASAQAALALPQLFPASVLQAQASVLALQSQLAGLVGAPEAILTAAVTEAQATVASAVGYVSNIVNSLATLMTMTLAKLQASVLNFETYFELPGIQVPTIALKKQSPDPVVRVLVQTPTGHTIAANDDPGNEFLWIIDRVGQILDFDGAVATYANSNNKSQRNGDVLHGGAVPLTNCVNQRATITLMDLLGQFLQLDANEPGGVSQAKVILQGISAQALIIDGTAGAEKVTLQGKGGGFVIIDSGSSPHVTMEDASGNNVLITAMGTIITSPSVQLGGNGAVKHLAFLEDIMLLFNEHYHGLVPGPTPNPLFFIKPINGTTITEAL